MSLNLILPFSIVGGGLKFIDDAFDEKIYSQTLALAMAPFIVGVWLYISFVDAFSATILFSVLAGVLISGKIDNVIFIVSTIVILLLASFIGLNIFWIPFVVLTFAGILDEFGNNYVDNNDASRFVEFFFLHRFVMKIFVFSLCIISVFPWIYFFAFLGFDLCYEGVGQFEVIMVNMRQLWKLSIYKDQRQIASLDLDIITSSILLYSDEPNELSDCTFYLPGKNVKLRSLDSFISL